MNQSITASNLRQAATSISQYCGEHAKGKAKQGPVAEAISHFLGYKNSNVALAAGKDASQDTPEMQMVYILSYKGVPTVHLSEESVIEDIVDELAESDIPMSEVKIMTWHDEDAVLPCFVISNNQTYDAGDATNRPFIKVQPIEVSVKSRITLSEPQRLSVRNADSVSSLRQVISDQMTATAIDVNGLYGFIEEEEGGITGYLTESIVQRLALFLCVFHPTMGEDDDDWQAFEERGYDVDLHNNMPANMRINNKAEDDYPEWQILDPDNNPIGLAMTYAKAAWFEGAIEEMMAYEAEVSAYDSHLDVHMAEALITQLGDKATKALERTNRLFGSPEKFIKGALSKRYYPHDIIHFGNIAGVAKTVEDKNKLEALLKKLNTTKDNRAMDSFINKIYQGQERIVAKLLKANPDDANEDIALAASVNEDLAKEVSLESAVAIYNDVICSSDRGLVHPSKEVSDTLSDGLERMNNLELQERWRSGQDEIEPIVARIRKEMNL